METAPEMIKSAIKTALYTGTKLDPFCIAMMEAINRDDLAIETYFNFLFDDYEHSVNNFYPEQARVTGFLAKSNKIWPVYLQKRRINQIFRQISHNSQNYYFGYSFMFL